MNQSITCFGLVILASNVFAADKPLERLKTLHDQAPRICASLDNDLRSWKGGVIPADQISRAQDLLVVCRALPEAPTQDVIETIGGAIFQYKPTAEPLAEALLATECSKQCSDIAKALATSKEAKSSKKAILDYLRKPKYPTLATPLHHYELMQAGAKAGLWKLGKAEETELEAIENERKKALVEFAPLKEENAKLGPTKHPKYLEEIKASIGFLERQMAIAQKLK